MMSLSVKEIKVKKEIKLEGKSLFLFPSDNKFRK